jgi:hypothetical protein
MTKSLSHIVYIKILNVKLKFFYHNMYKLNLLFFFSRKLLRETLSL